MDRENTVTDFAWAVAIKGRVGCGIDAHARSWRSGWKGWIKVMVAAVDEQRDAAEGIFRYTIQAVRGSFAGSWIE